MKDSTEENRRRIDRNCKMKKDKRKTTIYKTYTLKTRGELGCYGIVVVLAPLVVPVVLN
jgi:hypothetical protein